MGEPLYINMILIEYPVKEGTSDKVQYLQLYVETNSYASYLQLYINHAGN